MYIDAVRLAGVALQEPHPRGLLGTMRGKIARLEVPACHIAFLKNAHRKGHIVRLAIIVGPKAID
jgi:hypothetical protein